MGVAVGSTVGVSIGNGVSVGGTGVSVGGMGVSVGGTGVSVGGTGVSVGGNGVSVGGSGVSVGGGGVSVAGSVGWTTVTGVVVLVGVGVAAGRAPAHAEARSTRISSETSCFGIDGFSSDLERVCSLLVAAFEQRSRRTD